MRVRLALMLLGVGLAAILFAWARHLGHGLLPAAVLACGPLLCPALPAGLLLWAGRGGRDPYEVRRRSTTQS